MMRGDYLLSRWIGIVETNKNWLLLLSLGTIGGCLVYLYFQVKKIRKRLLEDGEVSD